MEFDSYQLILLKRPASVPDLDEKMLEDLHAQHIQHLEAMHTAGHLVLAGPFGKGDNESMRGLCLYAVESPEHARELAEGDPSVRAGRLEVEVMTFYCIKGAVNFPSVERS